MNKKSILNYLFLSVGLIFQFIFYLWVGQSIHPEFGDAQLFLKQRPHLQWIFSSSVGDSDLKLKDLNEEDRRKENLYEEFVFQRDHMQDREELIIFLFIFLFISGNQLLLMGVFYLFLGKRFGVDLTFTDLLFLFGISLITLFLVQVFLVGYLHQKYTFTFYFYLIVPIAYLCYLFYNKKTRIKSGC